MCRAASAANLKCLITPGSSVADSFTALDVANDDLLRQDTGVEIFSTFGIHPYEAKLAEFPESFRSQCRNVVMNNKRVVALGECGLDLSDGFPALQNQLVYFRHQLDIACELQLPLFLHERAAHDFFMKELMLRKSKLPKLLVHCFTGTAEELQKYLDFGCYISISGIVARDTPDAEQVRNALKQCSPPADRLLIETDAPYLPFPNCRRFCSVKPKKTSPNVPSAILGVAQALSLILGRPIDSVCHDSFYAATSFFGIQDI
jgi:TatD DNase family protein